MTSIASTKKLLQSMFSEMVIKKEASLIPRYYHADFVLETNGQTQDYDAFSKGHEKVYATPITYEVRYDDTAWIESATSVAARVWITTQRANEVPVEYEVVLIATYVDAKIHRLWELTWPDWTKARAFKDYS